MPIKFIKKGFRRLQSRLSVPIFKNEGHCPICDQETTFVARNEWLRDHYRCSVCKSIPRERALMLTVERYFPNWRDLLIHESSPVKRGASCKLSRECEQYIPTQYFPEKVPGSMVEGIRCENLESLTFDDESIDLHITQDVMEHVLRPSRAFQEVARTLKPGGAHIFTVPIVNKDQPTIARAIVNNENEIVHLESPQYHGNPISKDGSLVTMHWGYDILQYIFDSSGLFTHMVCINDAEHGIMAEYIEVLVTIKP